MSTATDDHAIVHPRCASLDLTWRPEIGWTQRGRTSSVLAWALVALTGSGVGFGVLRNATDRASRLTARSRSCKLETNRKAGIDAVYGEQRPDIESILGSYTAGASPHATIS